MLIFMTIPIQAGSRDLFTSNVIYILINILEPYIYIFLFHTISVELASFPRQVKTIKYIWLICNISDKAMVSLIKISQEISYPM